MDISLKTLLRIVDRVCTLLVQLTRARCHQPGIEVLPGPPCSLWPSFYYLPLKPKQLEGKTFFNYLEIYLYYSP